VWLAGREAHADLFDVRPIDDIAQISPRPIFILHGTADTLIPVEHGYRLFEAAGEPKTLYIVEGGMHLGLYDHDPAEYEQRILPFLEMALRGDEDQGE
jgi:fermentation-respiration switch protein FrsA (DUF1100 family)